MVDILYILYGVAFLIFALANILSLKCYPSNTAWTVLSWIFIILFGALGIFNLYLGFTNKRSCLGF